MHTERSKDAQAAVAQSLATWADWHRAPTVAPYGLPTTWHGPRQTGESQLRRSHSHDGTVTEFHLVELLHGDLQSGSSLRVAAAQPKFPLPSLASLLHDEQQFLAETVPGAAHELRPGNPSTLSLTVDGATVNFDALDDGVITIARADLPDFSLVLKARNWDFGSNGALVRLSDLESFIEGRHTAITARLTDREQ
jgi:hypothetical protein